ncbi:MAG: abortive infection family protein [Woeseiaceae bacterium]
MQKFDADGIHIAWSKALERKTSDPEGAITISRTILESVCKHILDKSNIEYDPNKTELPELYKKTAKSLNLSPSQHTEEIFKQILGGCSSIVNGLGALRNRLGDAHGKGKSKIKPGSRHAELAVNLSGTMALYLIETFNTKEN